MNEKTEFTRTNPPSDDLSVLKPRAIDHHTAKRFIVATGGSLSEIMGVNEAEHFLEDNSLARALSRGVIRRLNEQFRNYGTQ